MPNSVLVAGAAVVDRFRDDGRAAVVVAAGSWGRPGETAADLPGGALTSGDVGFLNPVGRVSVVDRAEHPAVRGSAVVGVRDDERGGTVTALVSLEDCAASSATDQPPPVITHPTAQGAP